MSDWIIIQKLGASDLDISFGSIQRVHYTGTFKDTNKIKLRSQIGETETFVATAPISRIRPLMAINIPGGITFFAGRTDPLVVRLGIDQRSESHFAILVHLLISTISQ